MFGDRSRQPQYRLRQIREGGHWYITWSFMGRSRRLSTKTKDRALAEKVLRSLLDPNEAPPKSSAVFQGRADRSTVKRMMASARNNAKAAGREFEISFGDVMEMWRRGCGRCEVSGIPFDLNKQDWRKNPWAPSLDRIDCSMGYVPGNVRVVCVAANIAMSDWGYDVLRLLAEGVVGHQYPALQAKTCAPPAHHNHEAVNAGGVNDT